MKRSEINAILRDADAFLRRLQVALPPFAYWTPDQWRGRDANCREIVERGLGWDITDFGTGEYQRQGLFLFTLRNGSLEDLKAGGGKVYAEKVMIADPGQITPMHFHWNKVEDIINRGGGRLAIQVYNAAEDETPADTPVDVSLDGVRHTFPAGHTVRLEPGQSITLPTRLYHTFQGEGERVLIGEVSTVNDDAHDNRFLEPAGRFPDIDEDEPPLYLLVGDYATYWQP